MVFAANGTITAVNLDAGTLTVLAKAGTKDVKGHSVTITAPATARVVLDDATATLANLATGDRVTVVGTHLNTAYTATKIQADSPAPAPTPTADPTPSVEPTPSTDPADTPTVAPSA